MSAAAEDAILGLLAQRDAGKTICPSDAAKTLGADWRERMDEVRETAYALVDAGALEVTQGGEVVDGRSAKGPIRLRLPVAE